MQNIGGNRVKLEPTGKIRFADGQALMRMVVEPGANRTRVDTRSFRDTILPQLLQQRPGYSFLLRINDSAGWYTIKLEGTLEDMKGDLDQKWIDYYQGEVEIDWDEAAMSSIQVYGVPPPIGGCTDGSQASPNSCLWIALNLARGQDKFKPICARMKQIHYINNDESFRKYLKGAVPEELWTAAGLDNGKPIAALPEVMAAVDTLLRSGFMAKGSSTWALVLLDAGGKILWESARIEQAQFHLRIVVADGHYTLATYTLKEGSAMSMLREQAIEAHDPLRVMETVRKLVARQNERGAPRPVRYVPAAELPRLAEADDLDELLLGDDRKPGCFEKCCEVFSHILTPNAYELTGSMQRFVWHLLSDAFGNRWRPVDPLGVEESRWLAATMGCSLTYINPTKEPELLEYWDQNSAHHFAMTEKIKLPCSAPEFQTFDENYFDTHNFVSVGVYRLQEKPLLPYLTNVKKPWRRLLRSIGSRRSKKLAGLPGSHWTHADINWAIKAGFPRSALRMAADGHHNAMVYPAKGRSVLSNELFERLIKRVYQLRKICEQGGMKAEAMLYKTVLQRISGQLATGNYGYFRDTTEIPCSPHELIEINVEDELASGRFRPAEAPLYKNGYARWLPFIQAKSRVNVAMEINKFPADAIKRVYTDGFYCLANVCKVVPSVELGGWKLEERGMGVVPDSMAKPVLA
nr:hypothetical protein [Nitrosomonas nitrosa]